MDRLTWRRADGAVCPRVVKGTDYYYIAGEFTQKVYDQLAAYEDAEEQGLLVRLLCKVGDTLYFKDGFPCKVTGINIGFYTRTIMIEFDVGDKYPNLQHRNFDEIGTVLFLTREEAEAAAKRPKPR